MHENYCFVLKKKEVEFRGEKIDTFEYIVSCCYGNEEAAQGQIFWEQRFVDNINLFATTNNEYYFYPKGTDDYGIDILAKYDEDYSGKYFTAKICNGKVELAIITNPELVDLINGKQKPINVYKNVVDVVKGQDEHVKSILASIEWNQKLYNSSLTLNEVAKLKHNLLIMGPTGVGKTEIIRQVSANLNIPITIVDATTYTEVGYVGNSVDHMLYKILINADENIDLAQHSILVIDEFDKLAKNKESKSSGINKEGVQRSLLTMIEGSNREVSIGNKVFEFNTHGLTIIFLGAFSSLEEEKNKNLIGFNYDKGFRTKQTNELTNITDKIVEYGFEPEIMGRINKIRRLNPMTKEILIEILNSPKGRLGLMKKTFKSLGIDFNIDKKTIEKIAELALLDHKGARSLNRIVDKLIDEEFSNAMIEETKSIKIKKKEFKAN